MTEKHSSNIDEGLTNDQQCTKEPSAIVGIGASAGGLEAFTRLLEKLPIDTGMAFVLVQHLDPNHKSSLSEILSRITPMTVSEAENKTVVRPNHVYVIPPNNAMSVTQGILNLVLREEKEKHFMPIDDFLESLAKDQGSKGIGVILSGTAADGTRGLKEVKNAGGITFAQKPQTAKFDSMPLNAITAGVVDLVLPPEDIAYELAEIALSSIYDTKITESQKIFATGTYELKQIFDILRKTGGSDFSDYKELTIQRRTLRRMVMKKIEKLSDYVAYLRQSPAEARELYQDILINVTSFFRDPAAFETLKSLVFPVIMKNRASGEPVRIWVAGCSTGEEAYSIAIVLLEFLGEDVISTPIQIFATDINNLLIEKARVGIYPNSIVEDVSLERLRHFFVKVDGGYQINKMVRDICIFARQEMVKDPPFSQLDLISCRNVIIYFGSAIQKRLFPVFHYSLKEKGFLFLGSSESVGSYANLFNLEDKKHKIYSRKVAATPLLFEFTPGEDVAATTEYSERDRPNTGLKFNVIEEANRIVLDQYAPAGVIVNSDLEIIQFRGRTGTYLEPAAGKPSLKLFKMVRDGLSFGLLGAINQAKKENIPAKKEGLQVIYNDQAYRVNVDVIPIGDKQNKEEYFLVLFQKVVPQALPEGKEAGSTLAGSEQAARGERSSELIHLEHELVATKENLQCVIEQYELTNESLRAANEEIQSSNEELQSMNEELETAKEELQSSNEELMTLNDEAQSRNQELGKTSSDLFNLFRSIHIPVVMLDNKLLIRRFNPAAEKVFNLIASDVGRPITNINTNFDNYNLEQAILEVIDTLISKEEEVQDRYGHWYSVQIRPYRTLDNKIDGVVITYVDIDTNKKSLALAREAREYAEAIVETVRQPLLILDDNLCVKSANRSFYQAFVVTPEETEGKSIFNIGDGQWNIPELRVLLEDILCEETTFEGYEVVHDFLNAGCKKMLVNARRIVGSNNQTKLILMAIEDITKPQTNN